ncbi:hypothetical protein PVAP13_8NG211907 [Panicum virgatum]|uniref:Uncharacterized protein n=1 Tax=Panicum virgatum TaxID=38727 RepID=A0A8T0P7E4_PANVG|nr:hypothetical protein PVAP13_8NG211907 [Panicum virgatum]
MAAAAAVAARCRTRQEGKAAWSGIINVDDSHNHSSGQPGPASPQLFSSCCSKKFRPGSLLCLLSPPGGRLPRPAAVGNSGGAWCLVARTCALSNDATFYSGPPATTPGATQQPQVSGGVQNPVASSQTAETNGYYAGPPIEEKQLLPPAPAPRPPRKQGSSFLSKWCSDSFIAI